MEFLKKDLGDHESENQKRQQALHNFSKESLLVEDNIWSGLGLLRGGGITAMVGSYKEIADLIEKFLNHRAISFASRIPQCTCSLLPHSICTF